MRVGISLLSAGAQRTGVENVALNLIVQLGHLDTTEEFVVFADTRRLQWLSAIPDRVRIVDVRHSSGRALWLWEHLFFLTDRRAREIDLVHFPIGGGVVGYRGRFVITIHDLKHYLHREMVKLRRHLLWRVWCKANIKRAAAIITVSEQVKSEILREFAIEANKVQVIPNGVDESFRPCPDFNITSKYQLPERYVLFVGQTSSNKNLQRAIDAMHLVRKRHKVDCSFVIAGMPGDADQQLKAYVRGHHLEDTARFLGYVDEGDLPHLYSEASLFLFPSLVEGFGLPPLEAMRCRVPVAAARVSCIPEVLGDAAIWMDPYSVESIAASIATGLLDHGARERAITKGLSQVAGFSWRKAALDTVCAYREATGTVSKVPQSS
jgi:glycosyltransferase involved in cell wall biosynthesis